MDSENLIAAKNNLENLKNVFSKFVNVACRIQEFDSNFSAHVVNATHELDAGSCSFNVTKDAHHLLNKPIDNGNALLEFEAASSSKRVYSIPYLEHQYRSSSNENVIHQLTDFGPSGSEDGYSKVTQDAHHLLNKPIDNGKALLEFEATSSGNRVYSIPYLDHQYRSSSNENAIHQLTDFGPSGSEDGYSKVTQDAHHLLNKPIDNGKALLEFEATSSGNRVYSIPYLDHQYRSSSNENEIHQLTDFGPSGSEDGYSKVTQDAHHLLNKPIDNGKALLEFEATSSGNRVYSIPYLDHQYRSSSNENAIHQLTDFGPSGSEDGYSKVTQEAHHLLNKPIAKSSIDNGNALLEFEATFSGCRVYSNLPMIFDWEVPNLDHQYRSSSNENVINQLSDFGSSDSGYSYLNVLDSTFSPIEHKENLAANAVNAMHELDAGSSYFDVAHQRRSVNNGNLMHEFPDFGHSGSESGYSKVEVSGQFQNQEPPNHGQKLEQGRDDYDEEVFKSFVENSDDFLDCEPSDEVRNELISILDTFTEHNYDDTNLVTNEEGIHTVHVESQNHLAIPELSIVRLHGSCDNKEMFVRTSIEKGKKLCCQYCNKLYCKLARHLEMMHKDEAEVQKFAALPKGSTERRSIQDAIRKAGTLKWNANAAINNRELIVSRRPHPRLNKEATDYLSCPSCTGSYTITNLRNHFADCTKSYFKGKRIIKKISRAVEGRSSAEANDQLREIIPVMKDDSVVQLIRYDWLLIVYGNILCMKYSFHFQQNMIRAKLRLAGRVLQALKNINSEVTDFASIYHPKRYKSLVEAIKVVGKFDPVTNEFGTPATASSAVTSIKQIGSILKCEFIEREDFDNIKRTENFLYLMESQFQSIISKRLKESQLKKRREKDHKVPSRDDVRLLSVFLNSERKSCFEELSAKFSIRNWIKLSQLTIASIIVFNRRRVGETQNILVSDFNRRESMDETSNEELFAALSEESKKLAKRFTRMKVRGKKGSNVNVLLKSQFEDCIELILKHHDTVGISSLNPYLFALPSSPGDNRIKVINAGTVLRQFSIKCGAKDPTTLRATNLRKHLASSCMAMELNDDMVSEVAKFMGHAEEVHRKYYRHNTIDREVVKIAKLLEAAQGIEEDDSDTDDSEDDDNDTDYVIMPTSVSQVGRKKHKKINDKPILNNKLGVTSNTVASAGRKRKKVNEEKQPKYGLIAASVTDVKSSLQAGQKRKKMNGKEQHPNKKAHKISVSGTKASRKRTTKN